MKIAASLKKLLIGSKRMFRDVVALIYRYCPHRLPKSSLRGGIVAWTEKPTRCHPRVGGDPEKSINTANF